MAVETGTTQTVAFHTRQVTVQVNGPAEIEGPRVFGPSDSQITAALREGHDVQWPPPAGSRISRERVAAYALAAGGIIMAVWYLTGGNLQPR